VNMRAFLALSIFVLAIGQFTAFSLTSSLQRYTASDVYNRNIHAAVTLSTSSSGRRALTPLPMNTADANDEVANESSVYDKIEGRKKRVVMGYKAMALAYALVAVKSAVSGGITPNLTHMVAGYILMPIGLSHILAGAASHDRLGSDTYKRMNLAMLLYGIIGLGLISLGDIKRNALFAVAFGLTCINTVKGYVYGVLGLDKKGDTSLAADLLDGGKDIITDYFTLSKKPSALLYQESTYSLSVMKLLKAKEIFESIQSKSFSIGALARLNRLVLFSLMTYTLKSAADRDRLGGSTFIQLNYLCGIGFLVNALFYTGGLQTLFGATQVFFSLHCAFQGVTSYMRNQHA